MKKVHYYIAAATLSLAFININSVSAQQTVTLNEFLAQATCETNSQTMQYNSGPLSFLSSSTISYADFAAGESAISCDIPVGATVGDIYASSSFSSSSGFGGPIRSFGEVIPCSETATSATPTPAASATPEPTPTPAVVADTDQTGKDLPDTGTMDFLATIGIGAGLGFLIISGVPKKLYRKIMFDA